MSDDVRIATGLPNHPKTKKLHRRLGAEGCWTLVCLLLWVGAEKWDGDLSGMSDEDIELAAGWTGSPDAFVEALLEVRFMVGDPGERRIHDWAEHNPYAASKGARIAKGKRAADARWSKRDAPSIKKDAPSMQPASGEHAPRIDKQCPPAPTPAPTPTRPKQEQLLDAPSAKRGCRLPTDWRPSADDIAFVTSKHPGVNWIAEAEKFRDYWHAQTGAKATKADWPATWRNWIRNARPTTGTNGARPSAAADFRNKTYTGTSFDDLPASLRAAVDAD